MADLECVPPSDDEGGAFGRCGGASDCDAGIDSSDDGSGYEEQADYSLFVQLCEEPELMTHHKPRAAPQRSGFTRTASRRLTATKPGPGPRRQGWLGRNSAPASHRPADEDVAECTEEPAECDERPSAVGAQAGGVETGSQLQHPSVLRSQASRSFLGRSLSLSHQASSRPSVSLGAQCIKHPDVVPAAATTQLVEQALRPRPSANAVSNQQDVAATGSVSVQPPQRCSDATAEPCDSSAAPADEQPSCSGRQPIMDRSATGGLLSDDEEGVRVISRKRMAQQESSGAAKRSKSVNSGWGNNFVRIDLKKGRGSTKFKPSRHSNSSRRKFGRGHRRGSSLRQVGDGADFMEGWSNRGSRCFKCGGTGHWAKECGLVDANIEADEPQAEQRAALTPAAGTGSVSAAAAAPVAARPPAVDVAVQHANIMHDPSEECLAGLLRTVFSFEQFRGLQVPTIQRVLRGESCLSIMPTGMGKSLCYQLPALVLPGLTVVISPLIALMREQQAAAPAQLAAAMLWSGQTRAEAMQILSDVKEGHVKLLLISPERLSNPHLLDALQPRLPLAMVVVDEAHCVAEWGHSFRPAYFRLGALLQSRVSARCVLALTATATKATEAAICSVLAIPPASVLRDSAVRPNLRLSVVHSTGARPVASARTDILRLLQSEALAIVRSAVVYCAYKDDADQLAKLLRDGGIRARSYHAGRDLKERNLIEQEFAKGRLRVVVATVAFGMGIDVHSVRAIIHATLPRSLEEYVQQVGRAGRSGAEGFCQVFLNDQDFVRLRSLAYSGITCKEDVEAFLAEVFEPPQAVTGAGKSRRGTTSEEQPSGGPHYNVLPSKKLAAQLDIKEETMETLLSFLEAEDEGYLRMLPSISCTLRVSFYAATCEQLAAENAVVAALAQVCRNPRNGIYTAPTAKVATAANQPPGMVMQDLRQLAARRLIGFEMSGGEGPAFEVLRQPDDLGQLAATLHARLQTVIHCQVSRLDRAYTALAQAAKAGDQAEQEAALRMNVAEYFMSAAEAPGSAPPDAAVLPLLPSSPAILHAAGAVVRRNREQAGPELRPHAVARILHGMGSPAFPATDWSKRMGAFWAQFSGVDFALVLAAAEIAVRRSLNS